MNANDDALPTRAVRAAGWSFANTIFSRLGTLAIGIALARVLGPHEFGIFAIALVAQVALLSFNEIGVSLAVVRWREDPRTFAPTVNTIAVASSAVLTVALMFAAPALAHAFGEPQATAVIRLLAVSVLLDGLVATCAAAMQREFMQRERTIADQVNTWLGAGLSLALAVGGMGAISLAIGRLVAGIAFMVLLAHWSPIPYRFGWDPAVAVRLMRFGLPLAAASVVVFASSYSDQVIVGSAAGAQVLGFYVLAFNLANWPVSIFSQPLRAVAPAAFSALKAETERVNHNFNRVLALVSCVALPVCMALSGAAEPVVRFLYGVQWAPAAAVLVWVAVFSALRIWFELCYDFLVVCASPVRVLLIQVGTVVVGVPLMLSVADSQGAPGVARIQLVVGLAVSLPLYVLALRTAGVQPTRLVGAVLVPMGAAVAVWLMARALAGSVDDALLASCAAAGSAAAVIGVLGWWRRDDLRRLRSTAGRQEVAV